jgi:hypothetical protein
LTITRVRKNKSKELWIVHPSSFRLHPFERLPTVSPGESEDLTGFADGFTVISRFVGTRLLLQHPDVVEVPNLLAAVNAQRR